MASLPDIILVGYGVRDTLQLTVEAQRAIALAGRVFAVSPPANLRRYLSSLRVQCVDVGDRFAVGREFADAYLDVADIVLRCASDDPPAVLLTQGNPLFSNAINRFVALEAKKRGLALEVLPAVSLFDVLVSDLGFDLGARGLQLFDARCLVERSQPMNPAVPAIVLQLAGIGAKSIEASGAGEARRWEPLAQHLGAYYAQTHPLALINPALDERAAMKYATAPLAHFADLVRHITGVSSLFVDASGTQSSS